jgi:hypothetical protein
MGEMCAHRLYAVDKYVVMSCRRSFSDGTKAKFKIYTIDDGLLISSISSPSIASYTPNANE